jgi:hypothetical protein
MSSSTTKETTGAWVIHHGRKLVLDANGPAEFPALDEAAKADLTGILDRASCEITAW